MQYQRWPPHLRKYPNTSLGYGEQPYSYSSYSTSPTGPGGSINDPRMVATAGTPIQPSFVPGSATLSQKSSSTPAVESTNVETEAQRQLLSMYQQRDQHYQDILNVQHKRHVQLAHEKKAALERKAYERRERSQNGPVPLFGRGYAGYGNGETGLTSQVLYPGDRKRAGRSHEFKFSMNDLHEQASREDTLIPIRIEMESDGYALRDTFTWNLNETLIKPEEFADVLCDDLQLPKEVFSASIARMMQEQIQNYCRSIPSAVTNAEESSPADEKSGSVDDTVTPLPETKQESPAPINMDVDEPKTPTTELDKQFEMRTLIKLDIMVGNRALVDQFEWDIGCEDNSPEAFADLLSAELGLGGEFSTAIAHSIREQIYVTKSLLFMGHESSGLPVADEETLQSLLPPVEVIVRQGENVERFTPAILELTDAEIEKIEKDRMREARRKRRQTRGRRGYILPDREPLKTHRTTVAIRSDADDVDNQFMINVGGGMGSRSGTPAGGTSIEPMHSQRRSALKARMNIAAEAAKTQRESSSPIMGSLHQPAVQHPMMHPQGHRPPMMDQTTKSVPSE